MIRKTWTAYSSMAPAEGVEHNDCAVRALAIALDMPYGDCHDHYAHHGRKWGRGTPISTTMNLMRSLGAAQVNTRNRGGRDGTLTQFLRAYPQGRYWVARRGHAFAVVDGVVHDWQHGTGPRSRVIYAWRMPE